MFMVSVRIAMSVACSYAEIAIPLFPGIPLTVLDVPIAEEEP